MKFVSVLTPCYNEEGNVRELYERVRRVFSTLGGYRYEHVFIDNDSEDRTVAILREIAKQDRSVRVIVNQRNFGHIRSPQHGMLQTRGESVVALACDLQDPPELIPAFLEKWELGFKVVLGVKRTSEESWGMFAVRRFYYGLIQRLSDVKLIKNATGFGLYDRAFVEMLRELDDRYPYTRGLIAEFGFECATIPYDQPQRKHGITKNNLYTLFDLAMVGITSHSKIPLRVATIAGFTLSALSFLVAFLYFVYKIVFWNQFPVGIAPLVIGLFLSFSVQLFFLGLLGEYVAVIHTRVMKRPLVVEKERINFEPATPDARRD
jgi:glycosyltransferase involved in cell wall biosynthesis